MRQIVRDQLEQAFGALVPRGMLGAHLQRDAALPAAGDEALGTSRFDLLALELEDLVSQRRGALVRHHAATATAAQTGDAMRLELDGMRATLPWHVAQALFPRALM